MLAHGDRGKIYDGRSCFGMCWLYACRDCLKTIRGCVHQVSSITTIIGCSWSVAQILRAFSCDETRARVLQSGRLATEQNKLQVMRVSPSCVGCTHATEQRNSLDLELACTPIAQRNIASRKKKFTQEEEEEEEEEEQQEQQ